jgi:hypothetical protein
MPSIHENGRASPSAPQPRVNSITPFSGLAMVKTQDRPVSYHNHPVEPWARVRFDPATNELVLSPPS